MTSSTSWLILCESGPWTSVILLPDFKFFFCSALKSIDEDDSMLLELSLTFWADIFFFPILAEGVIEGVSRL